MTSVVESSGNDRDDAAVEEVMLDGARLGSQCRGCSRAVMVDVNNSHCVGGQHAVFGA